MKCAAGWDTNNPAALRDVLCFISRDLLSTVLFQILYRWGLNVVVCISGPSDGALQGSQSNLKSDACLQSIIWTFSWAVSSITLVGVLHDGKEVFNLGSDLRQISKRWWRVGDPELNCLRFNPNQWKYRSTHSGEYLWGSFVFLHLLCNKRSSKG